MLFILLFIIVTGYFCLEMCWCFKRSENKSEVNLSEQNLKDCSKDNRIKISTTPNIAYEDSKCLSAPSKINERDNNIKTEENVAYKSSRLSPIIAEDSKHMQETDITTSSNVAYHSNKFSYQLEYKKRNSEQNNSHLLDSDNCYYDYILM